MVEGAKYLVSALAIPEAGVNRGRHAPLYSTPAPLLSSGMCTEVFQFDVSAATQSVANVSEYRSNSTRLNREGNRRILGGQRPIRNNQSSNNFQGSNSSMVVSVLVDPREAVSQIIFEYDDWLAAQCGFAVSEEWRKQMYSVVSKNKRAQPETYRDEWEDDHLVLQAHEDFNKYTLNG